MPRRRERQRNALLLGLNPTTVKLRWLDSAPEGPHRAALLRQLRELRVALRGDFGPTGDDLALIVVDPPSGDGPVQRTAEAFRHAGRPVATLRPRVDSRPEDLLIIAFDGLLAQFDEEVDTAPLDAALLTLLGSQWASAPERYRAWYQRALVNAAIARLYDEDQVAALVLLDEAATLGEPPAELSEVGAAELMEALEAVFELSADDRARFERVQGWLPLSTSSHKSRR